MTDVYALCAYAGFIVDGIISKIDQEETNDSIVSNRPL